MVEPKLNLRHFHLAGGGLLLGRIPHGMSTQEAIARLSFGVVRLASLFDG